MKKKIVIGCYGGGHATMMIPIIKHLNEGLSFDITTIGFTTAKTLFQRAKIKALGYSVLESFIHPDSIQLAKEILPTSTHPDISYYDTLIYHAVGIHNLALQYGIEETKNVFKKEGRKSFLPIDTFLKYLEKESPDLVITTSSPRSELALIKAAKQLNIRSLSISDLFLQNESKYICKADYADHITVMSEYVGNYIRDRGYQGTVHVCGNPAFDDLLVRSNDNVTKLRTMCNASPSDKLILWVCPSASHAITGREFMAPNLMIDFLEAFCRKHSTFKYIIRAHPNTPNFLFKRIKKGIICPRTIPIQDCLAAVDVVFQETSTVGLQAALLDKPVVTMRNFEYPPYSPLGLAVDVESFNKAEHAILALKQPNLMKLSYPSIGSATSSICNIINQILERNG